MKEPTRLLEDEQSSQSLRDALRALEQSVPSPDVVCRVEHALHALPPVPAVTGAFSLYAAITTTTLVALAVTSAVIVHTREPSSPRRSASPVVQAAERPRSPSTELPAAPEVPHVLPPAMPARERLYRPKPTGQAKPSPARTTLPALETHATAAEPITSADVMERAPSTQAANQVNQLTRMHPEPSAAEAGPVPQDDAGLLYRAKRLSSNNPTAALNLLEQHARHFPGSTFRQEREVLVIKLHERLGHLELARQLAAQFRARFPSSMYRVFVEP